MHGIGVGVQEVNDERFAAAVQQAAHGVAHFLLVERRPHRARRLQPLRDFQSQVAWDDRDEAARHAVGIRPGAAAEFENVTEAARGDQPGAGETAFQDRVGGRGRPMHDEVDVGGGNAARIKGRDDAMGLVFDGRGGLGDPYGGAGAAVDENEIGEGAADINAGYNAPRLRRFVLSHASKPKPSDYGRRTVWNAVLRRDLDPKVICILTNSRDKCFPNLGSLCGAPAA